jgi:hypothetical protein
MGVESKYHKGLLCPLRRERNIIMSDSNTRRARAQEVKPIQIYPSAEVQLIRQGVYYAEVVYMAQQPKPGIRRLNKKEYVILSTGEVKEYAPAEGKMREALRKTFQELRYLIRTNFTSDDPHQKFITLTYAENMTDSNRLYTDFKDFMARLQYHVGAQYKLEYIVVAEPQGRGAWHMHLMLKSTVPGLWIDKDKLTKVWGHGYTEIEQLKSDDVGNYYVAYFTDLAVEAKDLTAAIASPDAGNKAYVKGGRLGMYPKGFKFYRCSRGILRPSRENAEYKDVQAEYGRPIRTKAYELAKDVDNKADPERINLIQREAYKRMERALNSENNLNA